MKGVFGGSLKGAADLLQEQLQLAKATSPGYAVKVRTYCEYTELLDKDELLHSPVDVANLFGRKFSLWVALDSRHLCKATYERYFQTRPILTARKLICWFLVHRKFSEFQLLRQHMLTSFSYCIARL